ncbi:hypothetical protein NDN08_006071 [Rhodosorus marinus]|uniref:DUF2421 domain-containing protein n=1 Tax=Rhodosorus marinus TaxID=101924 RepID=A0AAV8UJS1_9RHOD|nr:hypothetical protein NDN08_006071 [Rhodosorus marinus]
MGHYSRFRASRTPAYLERIIREGRKDWWEILRWVSAFGVGCIFAFIGAFTALGCIGPILYGVSFISAPDRTVGGVIRNAALISVYYMLYPLIACAVLAVDVTSLAGALVLYLVLICPLVYLSYDTRLGGGPKLAIGLSGLLFLRTDRPDTEQIVRILWTNIANGCIATATVIFVTILFAPTRAIRQMKAVCLVNIREMSELLSDDMSTLLKPRNAHEADRRGDYYGLRPIGEEEVTSKEWDEPPKIKPFGSFNSKYLSRVQAARKLLSTSLWEPNFRNPNHPDRYPLWSELLDRLDEISIAYSGVRSAIDYEDVRSCTDEGAELFFANEQDRLIWAELTASAVAVLMTLYEWLGGDVGGSPLSREDEARLAELSGRLVELNKQATKLIPKRIMSNWMDNKQQKVEPGVVRSMLFVATSLVHLSDTTIRAKETMDNLRDIHNDHRPDNVLGSVFLWVKLTLSVEINAMRENIPDLSSPSAIFNFFRSFRFLYFLRFMAMIILICCVVLFGIPEIRGLRETGWVLFSAVVVHHPSTESTLVSSALRIAGTVAGSSLSGAFMLSPVAASSPVLISVFLIGMATIFMILLATIQPLQKMQYGLLLLILTIFLVALCQYVPYCTADCAGDFGYAWTRMVSVLSGVLVSFLFQILVFPRFAADDIREGLSALLTKEFASFHELVGYYMHSQSMSMSQIPVSASNEGMSKSRMPKSDSGDQLSKPIAASKKFDANEALKSQRTARGILTASSSDENLASSSSGSGVLNGVLNQSLARPMFTGDERSSMIVMDVNSGHDLVDQLDSVAVELSNIAALLIQTPVVTEHQCLRFVTLGISSIFHNLLRLQESIFVCLALLAILLRKSEFAGSQQLLSSMMLPVFRRIQEAQYRLGHMVKICSTAIRTKRVSVLYLQILKEAQEFLDDSRLEYRLEFQNSSKKLRQAVEDKLADAKFRNVGKASGDMPTVDIDFVLLNCIFFMSSALADSFESVAREYSKYAKTELAVFAQWGGLPKGFDAERFEL